MTVIPEKKKTKLTLVVFIIFMILICASLYIDNMYVSIGVLILYVIVNDLINFRYRV